MILSFLLVQNSLRNNKGFEDTCDDDGNRGHGCETGHKVLRHDGIQNNLFFFFVFSRGRGHFVGNQVGSRETQKLSGGHTQGDVFVTLNFSKRQNAEANIKQSKDNDKDDDRAVAQHDEIAQINLGQTRDDRSEHGNIKDTA